MGPVSRVAPFGLRFRRKRKSAIGLRGSAGAKPMVEPMELWQRLGHASYRDWVLAAQRARRVAIAAKKAAAKATMPAVQRQPSPPSPPPLPTPAPASVPYREEEVATRHYEPGFPAPNYCGFIHYESTGACHPLAACSSGLVPSGIAVGCCDSGHVLARRWTGVEGTCDVCKRTVSPLQARWECDLLRRDDCVPCNWWACDECNSLAVAAERAEAETGAEEAGLSVEEWQACRSSGRECNPLAVAAERAEAEEAGLSVEEWRKTVRVWVSRKRRRHLGQAAGRRLVSGRLCEDMQVTPQGRRKHSFKHTSPGGTIRSDEYFSPAGPSRGDQRASCLLRIAGARHAALPVRAALAAERRRRLLLFVEGFVAATSFEGARTGFAFKTGSMGLGYYPDDRCLL